MDIVLVLDYMGILFNRDGEVKDEYIGGTIDEIMQKRNIKRNL